MEIALIFAILGWIVLLLLLLFQKKQLTQIIRQLDRFQSGTNHFELSVDLQDKTIERLAEKINQTVRKQEDAQLDILQRENDLRQSIANVSHDLRTPLTSIIGYVQLVNSGNSTADQKRRYLKIIEDKAQMLDCLVNRFYELSVMEADDYKMIMEPVNLTAVLSGVVMDHYSDFHRKNIEPTIQIPNQRIEIWGDTLSCERIVQNIISNALRYAEKDFRIELCTDHEFAVLTAQNSASFLSDDDIAHMFDRFYTGDKARKQGSTGIGLTIVKILLEKMSGKIVETSLVNHVFTLRIAFQLMKHS